jgi:hypothetical protein
MKGRDWYDVAWYISNGVYPNLLHLQAALIQAGPWAGQDALRVDRAWLMGTLQTAIAAIDWKDAARDVGRFLRPAQLKSVELWSAPFFLAKLETMAKS